MEPQMCTLAQLSDGSISIDDLADIHEVLNLKQIIQDKQQRCKR